MQLVSTLVLAVRLTARLAVRINLALFHAADAVDFNMETAKLTFNHLKNMRWQIIESVNTHVMYIDIKAVWHVV